MAFASSPSPHPTWASTRNIALALGIGQTAARDLVITGRIPGATRHGPAWFVPVDELDKFAATYQRPPLRQARSSELSASQLLILATLVHADRHLAIVDLARAIDLHAGNVRKHTLILRERGFAIREEPIGEWYPTPEGIELVKRLEADGSDLLHPPTRHLAAVPTSGGSSQ